VRVAIIPARGGSRRIPKKNIKEFCGQPIIAYSIKTAEESDLFDEIIVTTEDAEIASVAREYGAATVDRPQELAQDECGTQEVIRHTVESMRFADTTVVCGLYATAPLVSPIDLNIASAMLMLRPATFVVSVGTAPLRDAGAFYYGTANAYLLRLPLWTMHTAIYPLPEMRVCDINDEFDWNEAVDKFQRLRDGT
jgi:pseudaminic acid cytidylyltransferase